MSNNSKNVKNKKIIKKNVKIKNIRIEKTKNIFNKKIKNQIKKQIKLIKLNTDISLFKQLFSQFTSFVHSAKTKKVIKANKSKRLVSQTYNKYLKNKKIFVI